MIVKKHFKTHALVLILITLVNLFTLDTLAQSPGEAVHITKLDTLLWSIVKTIQLYTLPLMALSLVFLGIRLVTSGEDSQMKSDIKNWMIKIIIGGFIIFGATSIADILKNFLS